MKTDYIRIAGAGLSGLSAAICLAQRGYRVEIFERNIDSGQTRHADWDAIENWTRSERYWDDEGLPPLWLRAQNAIAVRGLPRCSYASL